MRRKPRLLAAAALAALATLLPAVVQAHPLGNFTINHYAAIRVSEEAVAVDLVIDMAEIPSLDAIRALDTSGNGLAEPAEIEAARRLACERLTGQLALTVGGRVASLQLTAAGMHAAPGAGGLLTLRTVCELTAPLATPIQAQTSLTFADASYAERIGWREIVVIGDGVTVAVAAAQADVSRRLTSYPSDLLRQPLNERSIDVALRPGGTPAGQWIAPDAWPLDASSGGAPEGSASVPGGVAGELASIVDFRHLSPPLALLGLLIAGVVGAGHAVSPGHGKTVMAAYLVGSRGGTRHALLLGGAVTVSHTLGVLLLAAVVVLAGELLPPERLYPVLTVLSGATVVLIGVALLIGCVRRARAHRADHHGPPTQHRHGGRVHSHEPDAPVAWRGLAALGIAGGLVPSTSALILLLGAVGAGQPAYGLALSVAFGIGMATVLTGIGLAMVHGRALVGRLGLGGRRVRWATAALPWVTAMVVVVGGLLLTGQTLAASL
jgi:nickel/cobalt transporter (NicO) family protein